MPTRLNHSSTTELPWPPAWTSGTVTIPDEWSLDREHGRRPARPAAQPAWRADGQGGDGQALGRLAAGHLRRLR